MKLDYLIILKSKINFASVIKKRESFQVHSPKEKSDFEKSFGVPLSELT